MGGSHEIKGSMDERFERAQDIFLKEIKIDPAFSNVKFEEIRSKLFEIVDAESEEQRNELLKELQITLIQDIQKNFPGLEITDEINEKLAKFAELGPKADFDQIQDLKALLMKQQVIQEEIKLDFPRICITQTIDDLALDLVVLMMQNETPEEKRPIKVKLITAAMCEQIRNEYKKIDPASLSEHVAECAELLINIRELKHELKSKEKDIKEIKPIPLRVYLIKRQIDVKKRHKYPTQQVDFDKYNRLDKEISALRAKIVVAEKAHEEAKAALSKMIAAQQQQVASPAAEMKHERKQTPGKA